MGVTVKTSTNVEDGDMRRVAKAKWRDGADEHERNIRRRTGHVRRLRGDSGGE